MKKVVISSNTSWSIFNFRLNLADSLSDNNYDIILVAPEDQYSEKIQMYYPYYNIFIRNQGKNPIEDIKTIISFYRLYKKIKPDIVLHYTIKPNVYGTIAANFLGIKTINNIAGLGILFGKETIATKIAKILYRYSQKKANKIFFQNNDDYNLFVKELLLDKEKCKVLPGSGIDVIKFSPQASNKDDQFVFLLMSRLLWEKGIGEYVEAARIIKSRFRNVEFRLLGFLNVDNPSAIPEEQIIQWESEGLINYIGSTDDVRDAIVKCDCIVLPSSYREGVPRSLLEGASMAKPIITTDSVGCREVVDDGVNGFLCEVRNAKDLAEKMEKMLLLFPQERAEMGKRGREKIEKEFDESIIIDTYLETINEIIIERQKKSIKV